MRDMHRRPCGDASPGSRQRTRAGLPVLAYLARYTHRVAISNSRLVSLDERGVTFRCKDYRRDGQARYGTMTLSADDFIRRFLLHVLPKGFHRIRHYGLLASAGCKTNIARARQLIAAPMAEVDPPAVHDTADPRTTTDHRPPCPCCGGRMLIVEVFARGGAPRGPPSGAGIAI
jgi:Putative transposase